MLVFAIGKEIRVFESGSMMQYLVDRYDTDHKISYPHGSREQVEVRFHPFLKFDAPLTAPLR